MRNLTLIFPVEKIQRIDREKDYKNKRNLRALNEIICAFEERREKIKRIDREKDCKKKRILRVLNEIICAFKERREKWKI